MALATIATAASAIDTEEGGGSASLHGTVTFATMIRTAAPSPDSYGQLAPQRLGLLPGNLQGNAGGADLNFEKNKPVSTVLKAIIDADVQHGGSGFFARARLWQDYELRNGDRAYGNAPNGFHGGMPLSDRGFDPAARFSGALWADSYLYTRQTWQTQSLDLRLGRQVVHWGVASWLGSGIDALNPNDYAASSRPGLQADKEGRVPLGMLAAKLATGSAWSLDAALPYEFRANIQAGCGTFLSQNPAIASGCNYASTLSTIGDQTALANGLYAHRGSDTPAKNSGQFGLAGNYRLAALDTDLAMYWLNYHSRAPMLRATNANINGGFGTVSSRLSDPGGARYSLIYPEAIRLYGLSVDYRPATQQRIYGELSYRPNQPLQINASDLVSAFLSRSPSSALNLAKGTNNLAPGATFDNYDRYPVSALTIGSQWPLPWAGDAILLSAEIGGSWVRGLPDPGVLRYGRADEYGIAAINGQKCIDTTVAQKSCAHDGFVTPSAWGYRFRLQGRTTSHALGARWLPSLFISHDVRGYAFDGSLLEGRKSLRPSLRAEWGKDYFAEATYTRLFSAPYYLLADRSNLALTAGANF